MDGWMGGTPPPVRFPPCLVRARHPAWIPDPSVSIPSPSLAGLAFKADAQTATH